MKTLKSKLLILALLLIGTIGMSFALANKEKSEVNTEAKATTTWRYIGTSTSEGEFAKIENWEQGAGSSCLPEGSLPCQLTAEVADEHELEDYLDGKINSQVMAIVDSQKN